ncbi:protein RETICULATA-RELATED 4, chloroplastic-like [Dioscorea cayenensis subsp. rotundata]|uniref:Protein RETICULATA-RELATED 4, chloroplastic-like n=1 Tax=Dioscorea cayennensis subsp. rotundata TaxID=55577 RepID=A0AB40BMT5_DIOCR|nr:protein RETICULATA-RELATED 4, chloroplastic-like [Dioscorea cayenensis subsp. rotundata]
MGSSFSPHESYPHGMALCKAAHSATHLSTPWLRPQDFPSAPSPTSVVVVLHQDPTTFPPPLFNLGSFQPLSLFRSSPSTVVPRYGPLIPGSGGNDDGGGGNYGGGGGGGGDDDFGRRNRTEAVLALAEIGRSLESLPADLAAAIDAGRIPGLVVHRFAELEKSHAFLRWLLQFGGFKERFLADDLFLAKVAMECGVGIFTKTAAEWERRREKLVKELDFAFADVVMAFIADFMLVWLPAPTVPLKPPLAFGAGPISKFFYGCPDNAFQVVLSGTSYSFLQRIGAIVQNGAKLFVVGTSASLFGTGITNVLINARKAFDKDFAEEAKDVPVLSTSAGYGVYMAVSSNLRYQLVAGVIEQRILEPLLQNQKLLLSALCFAVRTGNTFLGSLMWVDYARWTGIQKVRD